MRRWQRPQNPIVTGPIQHQEGLSDCDLMQNDVWESPDTLKAVERYFPVIVDGGDRTLQVRYQAVRMPTTLVTDPWGNEVFRTSGYISRDKMIRILEAVPRDFTPLAPAGQTLKANPTDFGALVSAARFYEGAALSPGERPPVRGGAGRARHDGRGGATPGRHQPRPRPHGASQSRGGGGGPLREGARGRARGPGPDWLLVLGVLTRGMT